jgi:uncharacterized membrane protein
MIEAHTMDAWTRAADRATVAFSWANIVAGFAAPLFLWLAGLGAVLSAARSEHRSGSRTTAVDAVCRRGLELFILAFLFRLQAFVVSPGSHPVTLFRVDILNVMGPGIAITGLIWGMFGRSRLRVAAFAAAACAVAMATPLVRTADWVNSLPVWTQWYIRPAGEHTTFTAFPWVGFIFAGAAAGVVLSSIARDTGAERRGHLWLALSGAALLAMGLYTATRPSIYASSSYWTSSPTYFAVRVGIIALAFSMLFGGAAVAKRRGFSLQPLERMGQSSLFVYWIHVELVYGYATWPIHRRLPLALSVAAFVAFSALMYGAVLLRDRAVQAWTNRRVAASQFRPA